MPNRAKIQSPTSALPRMDRSKFKMQTLEEADQQLDFWITKSPVERLAAAAYLISTAWGFDMKKPPHMDKSAFSMHKHNC
ncbi:MAG: hypothetical protein GC192_13300 [Bacteroidetes bacterium]|nr:hypothetical protein [Bacteroidota bacterium]